MNVCLRVWGPIGLSRPARRATRRTMRPAPWRSSRCPFGPTRTGPNAFAYGQVERVIDADYFRAARPPKSL